MFFLRRFHTDFTITPYLKKRECVLGKIIESSYVTLAVKSILLKKDVPDNTVVAGSPARAICSTKGYKEKCLQKWKDLNLQVARDSWKKQLIKHFWG